MTDLKREPFLNFLALPTCPSAWVRRVVRRHAASWRVCVCTEHARALFTYRPHGAAPRRHRHRQSSTAAVYIRSCIHTGLKEIRKCDADQYVDSIHICAAD